jgi:hypothetical protein
MRFTSNKKSRFYKNMLNDEFQKLNKFDIFKLEKMNIDHDKYDFNNKRLLKFLISKFFNLGVFNDFEIKKLSVSSVDGIYYITHSKEIYIMNSEHMN